MEGWPTTVAVAATIATFLFVVHVAVDPKMAGVVVRVGADGVERFTPGNVLRLMAAPLAVWGPIGRAFWTSAELAVINWPLIVAATTAFMLLAVALSQAASGTGSMTSHSNGSFSTFQLMQR